MTMNEILKWLFATSVLFVLSTEVCAFSIGRLGVPRSRTVGFLPMNPRNLRTDRNIRTSNERPYHAATTTVRFASNGEQTNTDAAFDAANTGSSLVDEPPLFRAVEIGTILGLQVLQPLILSTFTEGLPENDWDAFWGRSLTTSAMTNGERLANALQELGPTYVKFGQALGSRPDVVPPSLADALSVLQDDMQPFSSELAKQIIRTELTEKCEDDTCAADPTIVDALVEGIGEVVAAASVGQVYKAVLPGYGNVAVKVQRPGIRGLVERDASMLRSLAAWVESIPAIPNSGKGKEKSKTNKRLIQTEVASAVEEFMSRIFEELDYRKEAENAATFRELYGLQSGRTDAVVVPEILKEYCTEHVLVMEWIDGEKLTTNVRDYNGGERDASTVAENLALIKLAIDSTLGQLLVTGVLHADPHAGNLLKVYRNGNGDNGSKRETANDKASSSGSNVQLGYLDFGLLSTIPVNVRNGLVCAVAQLVFARDVEAVTTLFGELDLLPEEVLQDDTERAALAVAMELTLEESLVYPQQTTRGATQIPELKFDKLLEGLTRLVPRFQFRLPPYFINNARALSTLEGIAKSLDPSFNVLQILYPYALNLLITNPSRSPVVDATLQSLLRSRITGRIQRKKLVALLEDSALLTGFRKRRVVRDVMRTPEGKRIVGRIVGEELNHRFTGGRVFRSRSRRRKDELRTQSVYYQYLNL